MKTFIGCVMGTAFFAYTLHIGMPLFSDGWPIHAFYTGAILYGAWCAR
ncbi:hypothetical protein SAMN05446935_6139 [Burkholderia sp. YR290]|nr:hypothetical protein SAMN05446935_6139 [Burkholderia sp. YR290]